MVYMGTSWVPGHDPDEIEANNQQEAFKKQQAEMDAQHASFIRNMESQRREIEAVHKKNVEMMAFEINKKNIQISRNKMARSKDSLFSEGRNIPRAGSIVDATNKKEDERLGGK